MKKGKAPREQGQMAVKHVAGQSQTVKAQEVRAKIQEPQQLREENADGAGADDESAFHPHARHRENQGGITKPKEIGWPVSAQVNRNENGKESGAGQFGGQRN